MLILFTTMAASFVGSFLAVSTFDIGKKVVKKMKNKRYNAAADSSVRDDMDDLANDLEDSWDDIDEADGSDDDDGIDLMLNEQ